jgi:hypothetical protein
MPSNELLPIRHLNEEWTRICHSQESGQALNRLADCESEIAALGLADLGQLLDRLHDASTGASRLAASQLLRAMLRSAEADPLIARAILQALRPGLLTVAHRLRWGREGEWTDANGFFTDLLATAWEVVCEWSGQDRPYAAPDLLSAVRCRVRRQLLNHRNAQTKTILGLDLECRPAPATQSGPTDLDRLARAIEELAEQGVDPSDAAVLYGHGVLGLTMAELAALSGRNRRSLSACRDRAARRLLAGA